MFVNPRRWLHFQLPVLIATEVCSLIAAAVVWPIELLETDVGLIPYFSPMMGLFLVGIAALFVGLDLMIVVRARRELRRQRASMP